MPFLTVEDLDALAVGAALLGSGGGGDPHGELMIAKHQMESYGPVKMVQVEDLEMDDLIIPIAFMGAPLIGMEKIPSGKELSTLIKAVENHFGKRPKALMAAEIGGANALTPLCIAGELGIAVLDGDTLGRAFPELQMSACNVHGICPSPAFVADCMGNHVMIDAAEAKKVEEIARHITMSMGSSAAVALYAMSGRQAKEVVVRKTVSLAIDLGRKILAKESIDCKVLGEGTITDIDQEIKGGFLQGSVTIGDLKVVYQNENLLAYKKGQIVAMTPDIIAVVEKESGIPITTESLRYGLRVQVVALKAPEIWKTARGLQLTGPRAFGYDFDYKELV